MAGGKDEGVAGVLSGQDRSDDDAGGSVVRAGHVFGACDRGLDEAVEEVAVRVAGEGPFPADRRERAAVPVALGDDLDDVEDRLRVAGAEGVGEAGGLFQGHGAGPGPQPDGGEGGAAGHQGRAPSAVTG
jgi:hypothetical protein